MKFKMLSDEDAQPAGPTEAQEASAIPERDPLEIAFDERRAEPVRKACQQTFKKPCEFRCINRCRRAVQREADAAARAASRRSRAVKAGMRDPAIVPIETETVYTVSPYSGAREVVTVTADSILGKAKRGHVKKEHLPALTIYLQDYHQALGIGGGSQYDMKVDGSGPASQHHLHRIAAQGRVNSANGAMGRDCMLVQAYHCAGVSLEELSRRSGAWKRTISDRISSALDALADHYHPGADRADRLLKVCAEIVERASREVK